MELSLNFAILLRRRLFALMQRSGHDLLKKTKSQILELGRRFKVSNSLGQVIADLLYKRLVNLHQLDQVFGHILAVSVHIFDDLGVDDVLALVLFYVLVFQVSVENVTNLPDVDPAGLQMDSFAGATGTHIISQFKFI